MAKERLARRIGGIHAAGNLMALNAIAHRPGSSYALPHSPPPCSQQSSENQTTALRAGVVADTDFQQTQQLPMGTEVPHFDEHRLDATIGFGPNGIVDLRKPCRK